MSKINQLIQNLCPAGVEYKKIRECPYHKEWTRL